MTAFITWPMSLGPMAPVSATARLDDLPQLVVGELGRQVAADQLGLERSCSRQLGAARVVELLGGVEPALALAAQHGQLVVGAVLGGLLQLGQHQPQRADALLLPRLERGGHVRSQLIGDGSHNAV